MWAASSERQNVSSSGSGTPFLNGKLWKSGPGALRGRGRSALAVGEGARSADSCRRGYVPVSGRGRREPVSDLGGRGSDGGASDGAWRSLRGRARNPQCPSAVPPLEPPSPPPPPPKPPTAH